MYNKSSTNTSNLREYVILLEPIEDNAYHVGSYDSEVDLTNKNGTVTLASNQKIIVSMHGTIGKIMWQLTPRYYNLNINQTENANKLFGGRVEIANLSCTSEKHEAGTLAYEILSNNGGANYIHGRPSPDVYAVATTNEGIFYSVDNYGLSYYFRGAVDNNWVKFGKDKDNKDIYWRILRINGDQSIRLIYASNKSPTENDAVNTGCDYYSIDQVTIMGTCSYLCDVNIYDLSDYLDGEDTLTEIQHDCIMECASEEIQKECPYIFGLSDYNRPLSIPETIGYMYQEGVYRGNVTDSIIKRSIDKWYFNNLLDYDEYIADNLFCNDRSLFYESDFKPISNPKLINIDNNDPYRYFFGFAQRTHNGLPSLKCSSKLDSFTASNTLLGNGKLTYKAGLITADEMLFAGVPFFGSNYSVFLYNGLGEWTMTPFNYIKGSNSYIAYNTLSIVEGWITQFQTSELSSWRPVISVKNTKLFSGSGEWNDPYVVITD